MKIRSFTSSGDIHNALEHATRQYEQWLDDYGTNNAIIHNLTAQTLLEGHKYTHIITVTYSERSMVDKILNEWKPAIINTGVVKASWPEQLGKPIDKYRYQVMPDHKHTYGERGYCTICGVNEPSRQAEIDKAYMNAIDEERDQRKSR